MNEKLVELLKDEDFCVKYFDVLEDLPELNNLLAANGIELTETELCDLVKITKQQIAKEENEELSEDDLEDVSGGYLGLALIITAIVFAYSLYKIRKIQIANNRR